MPFADDDARMAVAAAMMEISRTAPDLVEGTRRLKAFAEETGLTAADVQEAVRSVGGHQDFDRDRREALLDNQRTADRAISGMMDSRKQIDSLDKDEAVAAIMRQRNG